MEADFWFWFMAPVGMAAGTVVLVFAALVVLFIIGIVVGAFEYIAGALK